MFLPVVAFLATLALKASGQAITLTGTNTAAVTSDGADYVTSGVTYASEGSTYSITATQPANTDATALSSAVSSIVSSANATITASNATDILLSGTNRPTSTAINGTASFNFTATRAAPEPTNTAPCNGYPEFCSRRFSNITYVAAHNAPFARPDNAASNQQLDIVTQLNDGIRMCTSSSSFSMTVANLQSVQFQVHDLNGTLHMCHSSCDILDAGPLEDLLRTVTEWLDANPYDVITILMGNSDVLDPSNFTAPVRSSGLLDYVYTPSSVPMDLDQWPTLGEMILRNARAVVMLDYEADQTRIPWLMDEFSYVWETPFSPTSRNFSCLVDRPPEQPRETSENRMYMANHNLNVPIAFAGIGLDVPAFTILNETNGISGYGSLGLAVENCEEIWDRPPNFLMVDFYNIGSFNGSVFQVAADANGVTYDRDSCCGTDQRDFSGAISLTPTRVLGMVWMLFMTFMML